MIRTYLPFYKRLLKLAIPLVLTQVGQMTVQLVDIAMVGRVGTTDLAAASFANSIYVLIMVFGLGIFLGITPLIGKALGEKNDLKVAEIMKNGFVLSALLILFLTTLSWSITWFMPYMGQPPEVVKLAIPFYRLLSISLIPFLLFILLKQIGEGLGNTVWAMVATIIANLVNVFFNIVLIFGKFGFPQLGLLGSGYATLIARIVMPLLLLFCFFRVKSIRHFFQLFEHVKSSAVYLKKIFSIGFPIAGQLVLEVSAFVIGAIMMGWLGHIPLAAHQVAMGLSSFTFMIANGVAMAATIRVSFQLGSRNFESMEKVSYSAVHLVLVYMAFCGLGFFLLRNQLPRIFTIDKMVVAQASSLLVIAAFYQLFDGLQIVCLGILRGFADVKAPMFIAAISYVGIGLPVSYICAFTLKQGPEGIWFGFVAGLATAGTLLAFRIRKKIREVEGKI
jgi:multidrug resistance protein, MATE family